MGKRERVSQALDSTAKRPYPGRHRAPAALPEQASSPGYLGAFVWGPALPSPLTQSPPAALLWSTVGRKPQQGGLQEGRWHLRDAAAGPQGREGGPWATEQGRGGARAPRPTPSTSIY